MEENVCPLSGLPCHHPKVIHVTDVENLQMKGTSHLCQLCGNKLLEVKLPGNTKQKLTPIAPPPDPGVSPLSDNIISLLSKVMPPEKIKEYKKIANSAKVEDAKPALLKRPCSCCGTTLDDILKKSRMGCPDCYTFFHDEISDMLFYLHKSKKHMGKRPKSKPAVSINPAELEKQLQECIKTENYEEAHKIKIQLEELKKSTQ